jgi:hypothetical protein
MDAKSKPEHMPEELTAIAAEARQYLEENVAHVLMQGLKSLARERPENPADYLALYLLQRSQGSSHMTVEVPLRSTTAPTGPVA